MTELEKKIWDMTLPICEKNNVDLVEVNFKKVHNEFILEVLIDSEEGITLDDATNVNQELSDLLDVVDPIDTSYCLEVSSVGAERELKNDQHLSKAIGKYVNVKTYEKIQIDKYLVKEFEGDLISFNDEEYVIETMIKTRKVTVNVKRQLVAKIRLAIKF